MLCASAWSQTPVPVAPISGQAVNQHGEPIPFAKIRICEVTATGLPCIPVGNVYQDYFLTVPAANPYTTDSYGNYLLYVGVASPVNIYEVQITVPSTQPHQPDLTWTYDFNGPASSGTGTVISVDCGNLVPLFNCGVTTPNTTPTLGFSQITVPNFTFFGNFLGATADPFFWNLVAGSNIGLTTSGGNTLTISATGGTQPIIEVNGTAVPPGSPPIYNIVDSGSVTFSNPSGNQITATASGGGGSLLLQHNGVNLADQTLLNFNDTTPTAPTGYTNVLFGTDSGGDLAAFSLNSISGALAMLPVPPISGQYVIIYPTTVSCSSSNTSACTPYPPTTNNWSVANLTSGKMGIVPPAIGSVSAQITYSGFGPALAALGISTANVTSFYPFSSNGSNMYTGFLVNNCTAGGSLQPSSGPLSYPVQGFVGSSVSGGSSIATESCTFGVSSDPAGVHITEGENIGSMGLIIYYNGTPVTQTALLNVVPPLYYNSTINALGIDTTAPFPGLDLQAQAISALPPAPLTDAIYLVNNGSTGTDCSTGGGSNLVNCYWNGSSYTGYSVAGGSSYTGASPIVVSGSTISCPTCSVGSGTSVSVNGGSGLGTLNLNSSTPSADSNFLASTIKISGGNAIVEVPYGTSSSVGVLACGSGTTCSGGVISATTGAPAFSMITSGTNTVAAMLVGSGASLVPTGTGTIQATDIASTITAGTNVTITGSGTTGTPYIINASGGGSSAFSALTGGTNTAAAMVIGTGASLTTSGTGTNAATSVGGITVSGTPSSGQVLTATGSGAANWQTPATGGTVTSVALALPTIFTVSGSPVTGSGTLTGTLATQAANTGFYGPASGPAAAPTFRALVSADLPVGSSSQIGGLKCGTGTTCTTGTISSTPAFSALTTGTNTSATMTVGTGASIVPSGTGAIQATSIASTIAAGTNISITGSGTTASPYNISSTSVSGVASFNGRTGTVVPTSADYSFSLISGTATTSQLPSSGSTTINGTTCTIGSSCSPTPNVALNIDGGGLGDAPYQTALSTTNFINSPTTSGHTFFYGWQPTGSAILPVAIDLATTAVTSINSTAGAFTFSFSAGAGSCTGTTCTFTGSSTGAGTVTNFIANSSAWPSWLVPSVATSTTTPTLSVTASAIPNSALTSLSANQVLGSLTATTPSGLSVPSCPSGALSWTSGTGFGCNTLITVETVGTNNSSQALLNFIASTTNSVGLTVTPSNPSGGQEKFEITGSSYTGNASTATNLSTTGSNGQFWGVSSGIQGWLPIPAAGVTSLNSLTGALSITAGTGISVTPSGSSIQITNTGTGTTWPAINDIVVSNGTNSPAGIAPVNGDCVVATSGTWGAGSCTGSTGVTNLTSVNANSILSAATGAITLTTNTQRGTSGVIDLGLDNTGVADIGAKINTYCATYGSSQTMPEIWLKVGSYNITTPIKCVGSSTTLNLFTMIGEGRTGYGTSGSVVFKCNTPNNYCMWLDDTTTAGGNNLGPRIEHIDFQDTSTSHNDCGGLRITQYNQIQLYDVYFGNFQGTDYQTGTVSIANGSTAVTGTGTTFPTACPYGHLWIGDTFYEAGTVGSATSITLNTAWQPTSQTAQPFSYDSGGVGLMLEGSSVTGCSSSSVCFTQYGNVNIGGWQDRVLVDEVGGPGSTGQAGVSRVHFTSNGFFNGERVPDSMALFCGKFCDTTDWKVDVNNVAFGVRLESAHANTIGGRYENTGAYTVVNTCNGGVASINCTQAISGTSDATGRSYGNVVSNAYIRQFGSGIQLDSNNLIQTQISGVTNTQNTNNYKFPDGSTGCSSTNTIATIAQPDCFMTQTALQVGGTGPGQITSPPTVVGSLPAASSVGDGTMIIVKDAASFTVGTCIGGGSDRMIAISDGVSNWSCH